MNRMSVRDVALGGLESGERGARIAGRLTLAGVPGELALAAVMEAKVEYQRLTLERARWDCFWGLFIIGAGILITALAYAFVSSTGMKRFPITAGAAFVGVFFLLRAAWRAHLAQRRSAIAF